jgi:hypothetical protein
MILAMITSIIIGVLYTSASPGYAQQPVRDLAQDADMLRNQRDNHAHPSA